MKTDKQLPRELVAKMHFGMYLPNEQGLSAEEYCAQIAVDHTDRKDQRIIKELMKERNRLWDLGFKLKGENRTHKANECFIQCQSIDLAISIVKTTP